MLKVMAPFLPTVLSIAAIILTVIAFGTSKVRLTCSVAIGCGVVVFMTSALEIGAAKAINFGWIVIMASYLLMTYNAKRKKDEE